MAATPGTKEWFAAVQRQRAADREEVSRHHFASGDSIPDIDFSVDCPICTEPLEYDEGFFCRVCHVTWPRNGYGHEARREDQF